MGVIKLRPHHLLCTQSYSGKAYDDAFVENMNQLVKLLRGNKSAKIQLVFSTDDLCSCCPNMKGENVCSTNEKVLRYDRKVVEYFHLEEKEYIYQEITARIRAEMTPDMLSDICKDCEWYPISACRKVLTRESK